MTTTTGREVVPTLHIPLARVAMCLDCEACFDMTCGGCPACGAETWMPLAAFLERQGRKAPRLRAWPLTAA